ncbi:MAG: hypothetical protein RBS96_05135 [Dehalococcoidales bacterium]|jgi:putative transposase|nr:hypothetical protein [Syntrophales bacterium]MDX9803393.1 hypothetical protein [Dehalococcoidales bacterium]
MIDQEDPLSVTQQYERVRFLPQTSTTLSEKDRVLMRQIDEIHMPWPFCGSRKIRDELCSRVFSAGRDRMRRLRLIG